MCWGKKDTPNGRFEDLMGMQTNFESASYFHLLFVTKDMHPAHGGDSKRLNSSYAFSILTASKVQRSGATYALWSHQKLAAAAGHSTLGRGFGTVQKTWSFFFCCQNRIFLHPFSINFNNSPDSNSYNRGSYFQ